MSLLCRVFRSRRQGETYLYVDAREGLARVPAALLARFGEPVEAVSLLLRPERRLARAEAATVIEAIRQQGYYLQLPPPPGQGVDSELDRTWGDDDGR